MTLHITSCKPGAPERLRYAVAQGQTFREMRENVHGSMLYRQGDCMLVWVIQCDLLLFPGAVDLTGPAA